MVARKDSSVWCRASRQHPPHRPRPGPHPRVPKPRLPRTALGLVGAPGEKPLINATSGSITRLDQFRPYLNQCCLLLTDSFYEIGIRFFQPGEPVFCSAGLWREAADGRKYTMLTTAPDETVAKYHNRMPFIVKPELYDAWLGDDWQRVLSKPDRAPLEKFQKQPDLF